MSTPSPTPVPPAPPVLQAVRELAREEPVPLTVRGSCMAPVYADGGRVEIVPARLYWPGDVVAFQGPDGRLRLHRFLGYRWSAGRLAGVTRGDGCPFHDPPVPLPSLLGRVPGPVPLRQRLRSALALGGIALRRLHRGRAARPA